MVKNSGLKRRVRAYQEKHPGMSYPEAKRQVLAQIAEMRAEVAK